MPFEIDLEVEALVRSPRREIDLRGEEGAQDLARDGDNELACRGARFQLVPGRQGATCSPASSTIISIAASASSHVSRKLAQKADASLMRRGRCGRVGRFLPRAAERQIIGTRKPVIPGIPAMSIYRSVLPLE
jgi:hypothetical protein